METIKKNIDYFKQGLDEMWLDNMKYIHKNKDIDQAILESYGHLISNDLRLENATVGDFKKLVNGWLAKMPQQKKPITKIDLTNI